MRAIKSKDTKPELVVRKLIHGLGYRYRLHRKELPGHPDLVFARRRKVIFVHGCFWHGHDCKRGNRAPKENAEYWRQKIDRNKERDLKHKSALREAGWDILIIWECELKDVTALEGRIQHFLGST
jgi:DNA mismatch endonuclease, patch repair protein